MTSQGTILPTKAELLDSAAAALLRCSSITHLDKEQVRKMSLASQFNSPTKMQQHRHRPSYDEGFVVGGGHSRKKSIKLMDDHRESILKQRVSELEEALKTTETARKDLSQVLEQTIHKQTEEQSKMSKYSDIVA